MGWILFFSVLVALVIVRIYRPNKNPNHICKNCGFICSKEQWESKGSVCPKCGSDLFKIK